ncbi:helix-turn-helix domain-containing protein [Ruminococcus albus]|uniref:Helix-turn-helix domain-containing protein n=1 Tax=Ruminococcus albus TaxID=1264 RepID=A0A1H7H679_RUMAL|nr:helix-turn-helix domain-containing protein [Ruminococcus albus]SEK44792.1 Helix-turn-helix domain-containing protein [Ruminococcus albus]
MREKSCSEECCNVRKLDTKRIGELLRSGSTASCGKVLDEVLDEVGFDGLHSLVLRLYVCTDMYLEARSFTRQLGVTDEEFTACFGGVDEIEERLSTVEKARENMHDMLERCIRWRVEKCHENGNSVVRDAREYIDEHYMSSALSLTAVAEAVGISPAYLSALFKRETGKNLSEYITGIRIERSKELLCCTSKLIYEIAFEVGFQDYRYFSQIFKKCTGQTPRQFQNSANICM